MFFNTTRQNSLELATRESATSLNLSGESLFPADLDTTSPPTSRSLLVDPGSTLATAYNFGVINNGTAAGSRSVTEFVGRADLVDIYAFELTNGSRTQITLSNLTNDADIRLIQDANNNGRIESNEVLRVSELAGAQTDTISLASLGIGQYYLEVSSYSGNTPYSLSISAAPTDTGSTFATASELGIINGRKVIPGTIGISGDDPLDLYRFRLTTDSELQIDLTGLASDADLFLIQDVNNNGLLEESEILGASVQVGNSPEQIYVANLRSGSYFIGVNRYSGQSAYILSITADSAGETLSTARRLESTVGTTTVREFVGSSDLSDYYRFYLNGTSNIDLTLRNLSADADLFLIRDINNNGIVDLGERFESSINLGTQSDRISLSNLSAGSYFIEVRSFLNANTNYTLDLTTTASYRVLSGTLGANRFTLTPGTTQTFISGNGNVDFGQGFYDVLDLSNFSSLDVSSINLVGLPGSTGVAVDLGTGTRLFDSLTLRNGQQVLFEGIDRIQFANTSLDLFTTTNDPLFNQQWSLHMMGVHNAWRFTQGSSRVLIGIEDTGLAFNAFDQIHPDLNFLNTFSLTNNDVDDEFFYVNSNGSISLESSSHGTSVQSVISGVANNGIGTAGINWNSSVLTVDVLGSNFGDLSVAEGARRMINQAISQNQRLIINLSLGGGPYDFELAALANQYQNEVLFVVASGNDNAGRLDNPATLARQFDNVIAVGGSLGRQDYLGNPVQPGTRYNDGPLSGSNYGDGLTLMGPTEILAARARLSGSTVIFDTEPLFGGTSAPAASVTGVASLIWSANPNLTAREVSFILQDTAYDLGLPGYDSYTGNGFVNADAGVRRALALAAGYA
jgi:serine protease